MRICTYQTETYYTQNELCKVEWFVDIKMISWSLVKIFKSKWCQRWTKQKTNQLYDKKWGWNIEEFVMCLFDNIEKIIPDWILDLEQSDQHKKVYLPSSHGKKWKVYKIIRILALDKGLIKRSSLALEWSDIVKRKNMAVRWCMELICFR